MYSASREYVVVQFTQTGVCGQRGQLKHEPDQDHVWIAVDVQMEMKNRMNTWECSQNARFHAVLAQKGDGMK